MGDLLEVMAVECGRGSCVSGAREPQPSSVFQQVGKSLKDGWLNATSIKGGV